jgi:hypothetical protein
LIRWASIVDPGFVDGRCSDPNQPDISESYRAVIATVIFSSPGQGITGSSSSQIIQLADLQSGLPENVIRGGDVEKHVRQHVMEQVGET